MLPDNENVSNIVDRVKRIIDLEGKPKGWMRSQQCAKEYAKDKTGRIDPSKKTKFFNWKSHQVAKGRVEGLQSATLGKEEWIGLASADLETLHQFALSKNKKLVRATKSSFKFFEWLKYRDERKRKQIDENIAQIRCRREAWDERKHLDTTDPEYHKKDEEIKERCHKKYGLPYFPGP